MLLFVAVLLFVVIFCVVVNRLVAVLFDPPKLNVLAGEVDAVVAGVTPKEKVLLALVGAAAVVVVAAAPPAKLKAGGGAEVVTGATVLLGPEIWKEVGAAGATVVTALKLKELELEEEEVVVVVLEGSGTIGRDLIGPTVAVFSGLEAPKLKAGITGVEEDVDTGRLEESVVEGRLNVTVGVFTELTGLVGSEEEEGEEMVPKEKGVAVVEVTDVREAVGIEVAAGVLSLPSELLLVETVAGVGATVVELKDIPVAAFS